MCGRIACLLDPDVICKASTYKDSGSGKFVKPTWKDHPSSKDSDLSYVYYPSANIPPTRFTPVMYKQKKEIKTEDQEEKVDENSLITITPMMFGLIPFYHKGEAKSHGLSTNNARLEGILESKLYKPVLAKRKLCVILAQGFYEWKTVSAEQKQKKQPYLIFAPQEKDTKVADQVSWANGEWNETDGWNGPRILKIAGLYDIWKSPSGNEVYSYTIITMGANNTLSWLHDRMPAILETEEQVQSWLNATIEMDTKELLNILTPAKKLQWYTVDPKVGNSRCRDEDCMKPAEDKKDPKSTLDDWLKKKPDKKKRDPKDDNDPLNLDSAEGVDKKPKLE